MTISFDAKWLSNNLDKSATEMWINGHDGNRDIIFRIPRSVALGQLESSPSLDRQLALKRWGVLLKVACRNAHVRAQTGHRIVVDETDFRLSPD